MRSKNIICLLFVSLLLASSAGCLAKDPTGASTANPAVPKENLPEGFKLLAALPEMDSSVNMTDYIKDFYGSEDIGLANTSVGIYQWGKPGESYDAKITLIQLSDEKHAEGCRLQLQIPGDIPGSIGSEVAHIQQCHNQRPWGFRDKAHPRR